MAGGKRRGGIPHRVRLLLRQFCLPLAGQLNDLLAKLGQPEVTLRGPRRRASNPAVAH
jgi:hypothetical protein